VARNNSILAQRAADDATIPGKASTAKRVADVLAKVRNPLVRDLYVRDLAAKLAVPVAQVMRMVREATSHTPRTETVAGVVAVETGPERRAPQADELDALALLVAQPKLATCPEASLRNGAEAVRYAEHANQFCKGKQPDVIPMRRACRQYAAKWIGIQREPSRKRQRLCAEFN